MISFGFICYLITWIFFLSGLNRIDSNPRCIRISSGGIFFWWQAGAAKYIQQNYDLKDITVVGSSAGALTAALLKTGSNFDASAYLAIALAERDNVWKSPFGLAGIWGKMVEEWLQILIPNKLSSEICNHIYIAVTPINLLHKPIFLSNFTSKSSLIEACMASVHIPWFMNGKLFTIYDSKPYIDGSFWPAMASMFRSHYHNSHLFDDLKDLGITEKDVFLIDWQQDKEFRKQHRKTSIVSLLKPDGLHEMMRCGYNYMKKLDDEDKIRLKKRSQVKS